MSCCAAFLPEQKKKQHSLTFKDLFTMICELKTRGSGDKQETNAAHRQTKSLPGSCIWESGLLGKPF